jgi:anti-sigma factor (TIGR02949 family)
MRQLWDYLDGELTADRMAAIRTHLSLCKCCAPHADFEQAFLAALSRARRIAPATGALRQRVISALRMEGFVEEVGTG